MNGIFYLDDECEPLIQVSADRLQNMQFCSGFIKKKIFWICDRMTCKNKSKSKKIHRFQFTALCDIITKTQNNIQSQLLGHIITQLT